MEGAIPFSGGHPKLAASPVGSLLCIFHGNLLAIETTFEAKPANVCNLLLTARVSCFNFCLVRS